MLHQRFTTPDPSVAPDGWVLHGRVFNESRKPVAGFTVFFADAAKAYQQAYGFSSTDETGYFLLQYNGSRAASSDKASAAYEARGTELFVEVTDLKGRLVYLSDTAFQRVVGAAVYQDIVLTESASTKGEPPAQVRKVSIAEARAEGLSLAGLTFSWVPSVVPASESGGVDAIASTATWRWAPEKWASTQAVCHVLRSDCQQFSAPCSVDSR